jgi:hypothetical protein
MVLGGLRNQIMCHRNLRGTSICEDGTLTFSMASRNKITVIAALIAASASHVSAQDALPPRAPATDQAIVLGSAPERGVTVEDLLRNAKQVRDQAESDIGAPTHDATVDGLLKNADDVRDEADAALRQLAVSVSHGVDRSQQPAAGPAPQRRRLRYQAD